MEYKKETSVSVSTEVVEDEFDEEELIKPVTDRFMELAKVKFR